MDENLIIHCEIQPEVDLLLVLCKFYEKSYSFKVKDVVNLCDVTQDFECLLFIQPVLILSLLKLHC